MPLFGLQGYPLTLCTFLIHPSGYTEKNLDTTNKDFKNNI